MINALVAQKVERRQNMTEAFGSIPDQRTIPSLVWGQKIGKQDCPYMRRWILDFGKFSIRLHHWYSSDDGRAHHDHAWDFIVIVLRGGYDDVTPDGKTKLKAPCMAFRKAEHKHIVTVNKDGCWTLLICGKERRDWGFWIKNRLIKKNRYFHRFGLHPCDNSTKGSENK